MDDRDLENQIKNCWHPTPPKDMKNRVLARAERELGRPWWDILFPKSTRWRMGFSLAGLLVIYLCNLSGQARTQRIANLMESSPVPKQDIFCQDESIQGPLAQYYLKQYSISSSEIHAIQEEIVR